MLKRIKNAYINIKNACEKSLLQKYPAGVPQFIQDRYNEELEFLDHSQSVDNFEIARRLCDEAHKSMQLIQPKGLLSGSLIYYLISNSKVNPLPQHYYCPKCGYYEQTDINLFGIDLPSKECPNCSEPIVADGINIPIPFVWKNDNKVPISFDFNISSGFFPFAKRVLERIYPNNNIVEYGISKLHDNDIRNIEQGGYAILPEGNTIDDYPDLISYLDDGTRCISGSLIDFQNYFIKKIPLFSSKALDCAVFMQGKTGVYFDEISSADIKNTTYRDILNTGMASEEFRFLDADLNGAFDIPKSFTKMNHYLLAYHNSYDIDKENSQNALVYFLNTDDFLKYPIYSREDVYDHLVSLGFEEPLAFEYAEATRKGLFHSYTTQHSEYAKKRIDNLLQLPIPSDLYKNVIKCKYLFPRSHSATFLFTYAILAYYMKMNSKVYSHYIKTYKS